MVAKLIALGSLAALIAFTPLAAAGSTPDADLPHVVAVPTLAVGSPAQLVLDPSLAAAQLPFGVATILPMDFTCALPAAVQAPACAVVDAAAGALPVGGFR
jgi:hypothetical protein